MPTLPMQRLDVTPPRWRSLFTPGGCEFFEIKIPAHHFLLQIGIGNPYSEEYRRRDRRYRRRPTRHPPALPAEFPFAMLNYQSQSVLVDPLESAVRWDDTGILELGPARISWQGIQVFCAWNENPPVSFRAIASPQVTSTMTSAGAICEISSLRVETAPFSDAPGTISHVVATYSTVEFAAHYLRSISQS